MSQRERTKLQLKNFFSRRPSEHEEREDIEENYTPQYRLQSREKKRSRLFCFDARGATRGLSDIKPNEQLASWLHWMFRSNVLVVIFFMSCVFFLSIYAIAGLIYGAAKYDSECVRVGKCTKSNLFTFNPWRIGMPGTHFFPLFSLESHRW